MGNPMIVAVSGVKNSGKTGVIEQLLPLLQAHGKEVAVIKHDGHSFSPDTPGTDSRRFYEQGAVGTAVFDSEKTAVVYRGSISVEKLLAAFSEIADIILLEGFKYSDYPKIEVVRKAVSQSPVCDPSTCIAYVSDLLLPTEKPIFTFNQLPQLAELILQQSL